MAKQNKEKYFYGRMEPWDKELRSMIYKDLKIACIVRGMLFEDVVAGDYGNLAKFFKDNYEKPLNRSLLDDFDDWVDGILSIKYPDPNDPMRSKFLRLGFIGAYDDDGNITEIKKPRIKGLKKVKGKRERNSEFGGIFKGTKKELAFSCQKSGKTLEETIAIVLEKFEEAKEKSIRIWYNKAKKLARS